MVLPAYLVSAGLGSKLSMWLTPPHMNSQMTLLTFGRECGLPSGATAVSARAIPSRWSRAPRARPVKPRPTSARKARRLGRPQQSAGCRMAGSSADGHEVVVVEQHVDQVLARPLGRVSGGRGDGVGRG